MPFQATQFGGHLELTAIPGIQRKGSTWPVVSQKPNYSESAASKPFNLGPSTEIQDVSDDTEPVIIGGVRLSVEVKDGNGYFRPLTVIFTEGAHSLIPRIVAENLHLTLLPLTPSLHRRRYTTDIGVLSLTHFVNMEIKVPQLGDFSTKLSVGVLEQNHTSLGTDVFLFGKNVQHKVGLPLDLAVRGLTRHGQIDPGEASLLGLPPETGSAKSNHSLSFSRAGPGCAGGVTSDQGLRDPGEADPEVGPTDLDRLSPPGPKRDPGLSRSTSGAGGTPLFTLLDPAQSSTPTSIQLDESSHSFKELEILQPGSSTPGRARETLQPLSLSGEEPHSFASHSQLFSETKPN